MTPMRSAFVTALTLIEGEDPCQQRVLISRLLVELIDHARDPEEAGAAARFGSGALLYLDARDQQDHALSAQRCDELEILSQVLTALMLLRRGRIKAAIA